MRVTRQSTHNGAHTDVIAFVWDFDKTLSAEYMQGPLFRARGIDEGSFWNEVGALKNQWLADGVDVLEEHVWVEYFMNCIRGYGLHAPQLQDTTCADLREFGAHIEMFAGAAELLASLRRLPETDERLAGFTIEHHIVSTGFADMIVGSSIAPSVTTIQAVELAADPQTGVISNLAHPMSHAGKTGALYAINKGLHIHPDYGVDDVIAKTARHVPFSRIVYSADGPSDTAAWSVVNSEGGTSVVVVDPFDDSSQQQGFSLHENGRVQHMQWADYRSGSPAWSWYHGMAVRLAFRLQRERAMQRDQSRHEGPKHIDHGTGAAPTWLPAPAVAAKPVAAIEAARPAAGEPMVLDRYVAPPILDS